MAPITYAGKHFVRPAGLGTPALPLILRNPKNDGTKFDQEKDGPAAGKKIAPADYRMYWEGLKPITGGYANAIGYATSPDGYTWTKDYNNVIVAQSAPSWEKDEIAVDQWFYNPYVNEWWMYVHGGNNGAGDRKIGLMTSPTGEPGTWTRYAGNPILSTGSLGSWDDNFVADCTVFVLAANDYRMIYYATNQTDLAAGKAGQFGYATSTDGKSWTKYGSNPILGFGTGNEQYGLLSPWAYRDANGRIHLWYSAWGDAVWPNQVERVLYAYSDDFITWTRNQADVIDEKEGSSDPDRAIGDVVKGWFDNGIIWFSQANVNATYPGDALGALSGRGLYWLPEKAATTPLVPGRAYTASNERSDVNVAGSILSQTASTVWSRFRCPPGNTFRHIYAEVVAFNHYVLVRIDNNGKMNVWWRTPTGDSQMTSSARFDDNKEHRVMLVRRANADFELYVDGISVATDTTAKGTDATAPLSVMWGNIDGGAEPLYGLLRESVSIKARALTPSEELTLFNSGTLPGGVTATCWVKHGSGGAAGPDAALNGATYGTTITGTTMVELQRLVPASMGGTITPIGAVSEIDVLVGSMDGTITPTGTVAATKLAGAYQRSFTGSISLVGTLGVVRIGGVIPKSVAGSITPTGAVFPVKNPNVGAGGGLLLRLRTRTE